MKPAHPTEPSPPSINPWAIDKQPPAVFQENKSSEPTVHPDEGPGLPFEKLATPFHLRPLSALDVRAKVPAQEKSSAIPVRVASPVSVAPLVSPESGSFSDHYRSTSSSYPSQGVRTPEIVESPPSTVRKRTLFGSFGRFSKSNHRLSALFSDKSSTEALFDESEDRQPLEAGNDDEAASLSASAVNEPPPVKAETDDIHADERQAEHTDTTASQTEAAAKQSESRLLNANLAITPEAGKSTDTIVKSSDDVSEGAQITLTPNKPQIIDFGLLPVTKTEEPEVNESGGHLTVPSGPCPAHHEVTRPPKPGQPPQFVEVLETRRVPVTMSRTTTQQNDLLSGSSGRKPAAAVRITRRMRGGAGFGRWVAKRLRRLRRLPRRQRLAPKGQRLTEENLKRMEHSSDDDANSLIKPSVKTDVVANGKLRKKSYRKRKGVKGVAKAKNASRPGLRAEMRGKSVDDGKNPGEMDGVREQDGNEYDTDIIMMPNGRVIRPGKKPAPPALKRDTTIGRRAATWFKERRISVDLTRFLLGEMKSEMNAKP